MIANANLKSSLSLGSHKSQWGQDNLQKKAFLTARECQICLQSQKSQYNRVEEKKLLSRKKTKHYESKALEILKVRKMTTLLSQDNLVQVMT